MHLTRNWIWLCVVWELFHCLIRRNKLPSLSRNRWDLLLWTEWLFSFCQQPWKSYIFEYYTSWVSFINYGIFFFFTHVMYNVTRQKCQTFRSNCLSKHFTTIWIILLCTDGYTLCNTNITFYFLILMKIHLEKVHQKCRLNAFVETHSQNKYIVF